VAFLCGGGGQPDCPESGLVEGSIGAHQVMAVEAQGIEAGDLGSLGRAILTGRAYANVHTASSFRGGEIRGQIQPLRPGESAELDDILNEPEEGLHP
jgi:hypothetical protein